ncbi:MAG: hypothetical protein KF748_01370 [Xanthobacteraceae bacterium]|nr:hypothetical protein [Xanthobacteraceae bacterium]
MLSYIPNIDFTSLILGTVFGALVGTWYGHYIKRPKLRVTGHGGGGGTSTGVHSNQLNVTNTPGLLGVRIPETVLFGWRVNHLIERGLSVDRTPAQQCNAHLVDKDSGRFIKSLCWRNGDGSYSHEVSISSGQSAKLMLFCAPA